MRVSDFETTDGRTVGPVKDRAMPAISGRSSEFRGLVNTGAVPPTSRHPGGVNAAFLDGSVRFLSDGVDRMVWRMLGSIESSR